jgi:hypothetical protein
MKSIPFNVLLLSACLGGFQIVVPANAATIVNTSTPAAKKTSAPSPATVVEMTAATTPAPEAEPVAKPEAEAPATVFPVLDPDTNLDISFFIVEHVDERGNSHRFAANKVDSSPDATLQGFSMLISTILPEREIGEISGMFKIGDELWSFATRSIAGIDSGRLIVNTRIAVKDKETGSTELIAKEPYMTVKVIGNREQNVTEFVDVGVKIEAKPTILANGLVHAKTKMSISEVLRENDRSRATRVPVVSFRTVNTSIDFTPGKLELLSELTIQKTMDMETGIPYFRNIPFLGKLFFSHTSRQMVDTKLYIVGGVSAPQEEKIKEYEALRKMIKEENIKKLRRFI